MDIQSARLLAQVLRPGAERLPAKPAGALDETQAASFRARLQAEAPAAAAQAADAAASPSSTAIAQLLAADEPTASSRPTSLGDAILRGLQDVHQSLSGTLAGAEGLIDPQSGPMTVSRLLQFQVSMLHMGFEYQMVTGVVTKTAQNIDQLVKMQ